MTIKDSGAYFKSDMNVISIDKSCQSEGETKTIKIVRGREESLYNVELYYDLDKALILEGDPS